MDAQKPLSAAEAFVLALMEASAGLGLEPVAIETGESNDRHESDRCA